MATYLLQYRLAGHLSDPASTFASFALFQLLAGPLFSVRRALFDVQTARISARRIDELLAADERVASFPMPADEGLALRLRGASFDWPTASLDEDAPSALVDINLDAKHGQLVMIDGDIGSDKSALVCALVGDLELTDGSATVAGPLAFVAQTPSIWSMTLRENILFGLPYDIDRYETVIEACALKADLDSLPAGDHTRIGERGVTLSGGMKMRVAVARALYSQAPIMILECVAFADASDPASDVLAALDAPTGPSRPFSPADAAGAHVFAHAICGELARDRTRIFITHQTALFGRADHIVGMDQGAIASQGPPSHRDQIAVTPRSSTGSIVGDTVEREALAVIEEDWRKSIVSTAGAGRRPRRD